MKKSVMTVTAIVCLLLLVLAGCGVTLPPEGESATNDNTPIGQPFGTTAVSTDEDTTAEGTIARPDIRTEWGTVLEYEAEEPMDNVLAVRIAQDRVMHIYTERASEFCVGDEVAFTYDANAEPMDSYDGEPVWEALTIEYTLVAVPEKPVIYLYPSVPTRVSVSLTLDGELTCTYPAYGNGWKDLTAHPDGTLVFPDGTEYSCLYWEGIQNMVCDFSAGFCVKGSDTAAFLEWALAEQGLTPREANECIIYWLPRMEDNPYNVIAFQAETYTEGAALEITPAPDCLLRVFMAWYPSDTAVELPPQEFEDFDRWGFTAVEWGGCELTRPD